ncbi:hypothetical protein MPG31_04390 [Helicobacter pylori]|uniref:hypothetical protein n=1 Tax=Helicobacter pylori TaxID=210 RepID=UPI001FD3B235|nr:hypothetical protein [Helicobacter pylori]UOR45753.1 hypothetical protein MPG31_04390 [Helicobacter pylori]
MRAKINKVFTKTIQVQECFKYILGDYYTYLCYYGGRGGGKSESIAQMLVLRATTEPRVNYPTAKAIGLFLASSLHN